MSEEVKFNEEEIKKLQDIQDKYIEIQSGLGQVSMAKLKLNKQLDLLADDGDELMVQFEKNQKDEMDFIADIRKKYGDGTLDPKTGVFTPENK